MALSYTEGKDDIILIKDKLEEVLDYSPSIMSKIETMKGIDNSDEIIEHSDSLMLARGCLVLNIGISRLLYYQDLVLDKCKKRNCKLYIASELLSSLGKKEWPSRSDICDISYIVKKVLKI
nr:MULTISPECIES: pyruvate kinase [Clostridium]